MKTVNSYINRNAYDLNNFIVQRKALTKTMRTHELGLLKKILKQREELQLKIHVILHKYAVIFYGKAKI
jgi:hypothetical protein